MIYGCYGVSYTLPVTSAPAQEDESGKALVLHATRKARQYDRPAWPVNLLREAVRQLQVLARVRHRQTYCMQHVIPYQNTRRFGRQGTATLNFHRR